MGCKSSLYLKLFIANVTSVYYNFFMILSRKQTGTTENGTLDVLPGVPNAPGLCQRIREIIAPLDE